MLGFVAREYKRDRYFKLTKFGSEEYFVGCGFGREFNKPKDGGLWLYALIKLERGGKRIVYIGLTVWIDNRIKFHIKSGKDYLIAILCCKLLEYRMHNFARPTPLCPKIYQDSFAITHNHIEI